ncbi:MAG: hypothetical protein LBC12_04520 [Nitrososphaerota archaeon]|nr:hypothetical protein [Nitrososphaerota archaeon]
MENFCLNSAKSYIGKNVNLHLKDGAVIVNVQLMAIKKTELGKTNLLEYTSLRNRSSEKIPLRNIAYAELLNQSVLFTQKLNSRVR